MKMFEVEFTIQSKGSMRIQSESNEQAQKLFNVIRQFMEWEDPETVVSQVSLKEVFEDETADFPETLDFTGLPEV